MRSRGFSGGLIVRAKDMESLEAVKEVMSFGWPSADWVKNATPLS